jgi:hypothetical protein
MHLMSICLFCSHPYQLRNLALTEQEPYRTISSPACLQYILCKTVPWIHWGLCQGTGSKQHRLVFLEAAKGPPLFCESQEQMTFWMRK